MKKRTLIAILGLWIALVPFLGVPATWRSNLIILSGLVVTVLAFSRKRTPKPTDFSEQAIVREVLPKPSVVSTPTPEPIKEEAPTVQLPPEPKKLRKPRAIKLAVVNSTESDALPESAPEELPVGIPVKSMQSVSKAQKVMKV